VNAYVIPSRGGSVDARELIAYCKEHLAHYKVPRKIDIVDELPRSGIGKILKRELRYW
jgi:acyl-CoA synthetase (AMP-forming)/AMP-acid ligase II